MKQLSSIVTLLLLSGCAMNAVMIESPNSAYGPVRGSGSVRLFITPFQLKAKKMPTNKCITLAMGSIKSSIGKSRKKMKRQPMKPRPEKTRVTINRCMQSNPLDLQNTFMSLLSAYYRGRLYRSRTTVICPTFRNGLMALPYT